MRLRAGGVLTLTDDLSELVLDPGAEGLVPVRVLVVTGIRVGVKGCGTVGCRRGLAVLSALGVLAVLAGRDLLLLGLGDQVVDLDVVVLLGAGRLADARTNGLGLLLTPELSQAVGAHGVEAPERLTVPAEHHDGFLNDDEPELGLPHLVAYAGDDHSELGLLHVVELTGVGLLGGTQRPVKVAQRPLAVRLNRAVEVKA